MHINWERLKMCKSKHLESTFIETIIQQNKNITLGCVYRHPCMELSEFSSDQKWKKWLKLLKRKNDFNTSFVPQVTTPTHLSPRSKIDNIFATDNTKYTISGNILTIISNNLAQFILFLIAQLKRDIKKDIYERSFKNFRPCAFQLELENFN